MCRKVSAGADEAVARNACRPKSESREKADPQSGITHTNAVMAGWHEALKHYEGQKDHLLHTVPPSPPGVGYIASPAIVHSSVHRAVGDRLPRLPCSDKVMDLRREECHQTWLPSSPMYQTSPSVKLQGVMLACPPSGSAGTTTTCHAVGPVRSPAGPPPSFSPSNVITVPTAHIPPPPQPPPHARAAASVPSLGASSRSEPENTNPPPQRPRPLLPLPIPRVARSVAAVPFYDATTALDNVEALRGEREDVRWEAANALAVAAAMRQKAERAEEALAELQAEVYVLRAKCKGLEAEVLDEGEGAKEKARSYLGTGRSHAGPEEGGDKVVTTATTTMASVHVVPDPAPGYPTACSTVPSPDAFIFTFEDQLQYHETIAVSQETFPFEFRDNHEARRRARLPTPPQAPIHAMYSEVRRAKAANRSTLSIDNTSKTAYPK